MAVKLELIGKRFGRLEVMIYVGKNKNNQSTWLCKCDCGNETIVIGHLLSSGHTRSCGCLKRENKLIAERNRKHGGRNTRLYSIWHDMKTRCYNPKCKSFPGYGGRGITIDKE